MNSNMKKITTVIFDLDGTLLNTLTDITNSVNHALQQSNFPIHTEDEVKTYVGNGAKLLIKRAMPENHTEEQFNTVFAEYMEYYILHSNDNTKPYDGVLQTLKALKLAGIKTAILSNKPDEQTKPLANVVFEGTIDFARGQVVGIPEKPAPDGVYSVLETLNSLPEETIFVGDSDVDILTGKNANLYSVGVSWGFRPTEVLLKNGADTIINHMSELLDIVEKTNS
ncbi:MAG: HAD family hydrolase [Clostridia bacterium]